MGTKNKPGDYDCYAKLADDEPYFLLRAKDPHAPALVELWASLRAAEFGEYLKLDEARAVAVAMREWRIQAIKKRSEILEQEMRR